MIRRIVAVGLMAVLMAVGLGILPGLKSSHGLGRVAHAMANVESLHLVVKKAHPKTGKRSTGELWIKLPSQYRLKDEHGEVAGDGHRTVAVGTFNGVTTATISPSEGLKGLDLNDSYLTLFDCRELVKNFGDKVLSRTSTNLPDGHPATVFDFGSMRLTVDDATDLPARVEDYSADGTLRKVIERIDYNVKIPDSMFRLQTPRHAVVIDTTKPASLSAEVDRQREVAAAKLEAAGAWKLAWRAGVPISSVYDQNTGSVGSPAHSGMRFRPLDAGKAWLFYLPGKNSYMVLGRWVVTDEKTAGYHLAVHDREFVALRKAEILNLRQSPRVLVADGKPGTYDPWTQLQNIGPGTLTIIEKPSWKGGTYYEIKGRARRIPEGRIYQNETAALDELNGPPVDEPYPANLYWGNLTANEISNRKIHIDFHNKVAAFLSNKNAKGYPVYQGAEIQVIGLLDDTVPLKEGKLEFYRLTWKDYPPYQRSAGDWRKERGYVLKVPGKHKFICLGNVKMKYPWRKARIVSDSAVTFDGEILPLEECLFLH